MACGAVLALIILDHWAAIAHAQAQNPFGAPRNAPAPAGGLVGWLLAKQAEFYRAMSGTIRAAKTDGSAVTTLLGISFLYGIFHAAGPGHGKAVISSYMVANEETARRGILLSFASALLQALVAIVIVAVGALVLQATSRAMCDAERVIEIVSYGLIAVLGARLVWVKGFGFLRAWRGGAADDHARHGHAHDHRHEVPHALAAAQTHDHAHHHAHDHPHDHQPHDSHLVHDEHCGHSHGPEPKDLAGPGGLKRGLMAIFAVGLRPCSGAILVLVFALAQGLFWAGVAATFMMGLGTAITVTVFALVAVGARSVAARIASAGNGRGVLVLRFVEVAAAVLVLIFGVALLAGYMAAERGACL